MLSIGKLGQGQADYYLQAVGQGIEDYYSGHGEAPGRWLGTATGELELSGQVEADALRAILSGNRPDNNGSLAQPARGRSRVPGFDLTFSAPKSVSVLYGLGNERVSREVRDAHEAAVDAALSYMERHAAVARRGHGGSESVLGNGFIAAAFRHRTSRAGDPQLHTHVLTANITRGPDGRWTALDARHLYTHARTGGFLYQAHLRDELTRRLGVEFTPVRRGVAEVAGIPPAVLRAFSRRRAEIEQELAQRGETSAKAAQVAALDTRRVKDYAVPALQLQQRWRERARQLDLEPERVGDLFGETSVQPLTGEQVESVDDELGSPSGLTRQAATFNRRDAIRAWCEQLPHGAPVEQVEELAAGLLRSERVVPLAQDVRRLTHSDVVRRADGRLVSATSEERRYSTPELLALERRILHTASDTRGGDRGTVRTETLAAVLAARPELSAEQAEMVRRLTTDGDGIAVVVGKAGSGKTYALDAARQAWQADGHNVIGAALARRAALELRDGAGIESTSIHALLAQLRDQPTDLLSQRTVLVVDEAGMVGTRQLAELVDHTETAGAKLVLVGDPQQLPEIDAGGIFRSLTLRAEPIRLEDNRRQEQRWEREALDLLASGHAEQALDQYRRHGRLVIGEDAADTRRRLVEDYWQATSKGREAIMVALRRDDVADLNARARALAAADGRLGAQELIVMGRPFAVGDQVVTLRNHSRLGVTNGTHGDVTAIDVERGELTLQDRNGEQYTLTNEYLQQPTSSGRSPIDYGYALTGHKAQGLTTGSAFVLGSPELYREWGYVALSRGRADNRLYVVAPESPERAEIAPAEPPTPALDQLQRALQRSQAQHAASDLSHGPLAQTPTTELADRAQQLTRSLQAAERRERRTQASAQRRTRADRRQTPQAATTRSERTQEVSAERRELASIHAELDRRQRPIDATLLLDPPGYLIAELGRPPDQGADRAAWLSLARRIDAYRERNEIIDPERALPAKPRATAAEIAELRAIRAEIRTLTSSREQAIDREGATREL